jgi:NADH-quinone oxidoreductase subunit K
MLTPIYFFALSAVLLGLGLLLVITRRNAVAALLGVELMLNAANLNLVGFNRLYPARLDGQLTALFAIVLAAAMAAVGLALVLNVYRHFRTVNLDEIDRLRN